MRLLILTDSGKWEDLTIGKESSVILNYYYDSLENPTSYISEHSYTFELPRDANNSKIFSQFDNLDSIITTGTFSPYRKHNFILLDDTNDCITTGLIALESITKQSFKVSLQGSLGLIFYKLLNSGYDTTNTDSSYYLMTDYLKKYCFGGQWVDRRNIVNREAVYNSFYYSPDQIDFSLSELKTNLITATIQAPSQAYGLNLKFRSSLIGFAPTNQGFYKDFDSKSWYVPDNSTLLRYITKLPIGDYDSTSSNNMEIDDGLTERQLAEYRSYYQQPYVYVNKLFQMYQESCYDITGYNMILDNRWFNDSDTLLGRTIYMLPQLFNDNEDRENEVVQEGENITSEIQLDDEHPSSDTDLASYWNNVRTTSQIFSTSYGTLGGKEREYKFNIALKIRTSAEQFSTMWSMASSNGRLPIVLTYKVMNGSNVLYEKRRIIIPLSAIKENGVYIQEPDDLDLSDIYQWAGSEDITFTRPDTIDPRTTNEYTIYSETQTIKISNSDNNTTWNPTVECRWGFIGSDVLINDNNLVSPLCSRFAGAWGWYWSGNSDCHWFMDCVFTELKVSDFDNRRSGGILSFERLFKDDIPFNILLKYTKLNNLVWVVDDQDKTITIKRRQDYFNDSLTENGIKNIGNFVDFSTLEVIPISWDYKYAMFNYSEPDETYLKNYLEEYKQQYGSMKVITANDLNDETKNYFEEPTIISPSCMSTQILLTYENYKNLPCNKIQVESEPFITNIEDDSSANLSGNFYIRNSNSTWNSNINPIFRQDENGAFILITDDLPYEVDGEDYSWHYGEYYGVKCYIRPQFDITDENDTQAITFAVTREYYVPSKKPDNVSYVYERCWENYIEEVYNTQNKTINFNIVLSPQLYIYLKENPVVRISNIIYLIKQIEYSPGNEMAKMTAIQITDLDKLKN